jgi:hypothetical protein
MLRPADQTFNDGQRAAKIHVGYPHGQDIFVTEQLFRSVPLDRISVKSVVDLIEIVVHVPNLPMMALSFYCCAACKKAGSHSLSATVYFHRPEPL